MKRLGMALFLLFFVLLPVLSVGAQTRGVILHAEYGAGNHWVDVTQRVRALFRGDEANFRADNATFGGDPAPGVVKTLRLDVRDDRGGTTQLTFHESENVTLRGYRWDDRDNSDNRGDPNRRDGDRRDGDRRDVSLLQITRALYGADKRMMDVTGRLNAQIRDGQLRVPVRNDTMGSDPAKNKPKTLTVWYIFNGRANQVTVNENDYLQLPGDSGRGNANRGDDNRGNDNRDNDQRGYDQARMERIVLPPGTEIAVRTDERIDSRDVVEGQTFRAEIADDVRDTNGSIAIPRGSDARLITRRLEGNGDITLDIQSLSVAGRRYRVSTEDAELENHRDGVGANQRTGEYVGGGAAIGAIVGAIAGGGRGAAIGAIVGAGAGAGTQIVTQGKEVHVPEEAVIRFRLDRPLHLHLWQ
jgi:hypothetical protein